MYDITSDLPNQEEEIVLDDCDLPQPLDTAADVIKILSDKHYPVHPELKSTLMDHQIRNAGNEIVILTTPAAGPAGGGGRLNKEKGT